MAYKINWLVPGHVIHVVMTDAVTPEEVQEFSKATYDLLMAQEPGHLVHVLSDSRNANLAASIHKYASAISTPSAPNIGWIITVGNTKVIALLSTILAKITKTSFTYFTSMNEAVKFLRERDLVVDAYLSEHPDATIA